MAVMRVGSEHALPTLRRHCEVELEPAVRVDNCVSILVLCDELGAEHLKGVCARTIADLDGAAGIRRIEAAIGTGRKGPTEAEKQTALVGRRSITSTRDLSKGTVLTESDIKIVRPGTGLAPRHLPLVLGCTLSRDVPADTPLVAEDIHD